MLHQKQPTQPGILMRMKFFGNWALTGTVTISELLTEGF